MLRLWGVIAKLPMRSLIALTPSQLRWTYRALHRGVWPWPTATARQQRLALEENRDLIKRVQQKISGLQVHETKDFFFCTNVPNTLTSRCLQILEATADLWRGLFEVGKGDFAWLGKCPVFAFRNAADFLRFELIFMHHLPDGAGAGQGICHPKEDGRVLVSCCRQGSASAFTAILAHEVSHAFTYRYRTWQSPPAWVNEGLAEWIAQRVVPDNRTVTMRGQQALQRIRQTHSLEGALSENKPKKHPWQYGIENWQYGTAYALTAFLIERDQDAYVRFIRGIKEGQRCEESLRTQFDFTSETLAAAFGESISVLDLAP